MTMESIYLEVGRLIATTRKLRGMSQEKLGRAAGYSRANVANIETGQSRVMLHCLPKFAKALGVRPSELLPARWAWMKKPGIARGYLVKG